MPLVLKPPAWVPVVPRVSEAMVELIDFPATVEALADITPGHTHFRRSLVPLLAGETDEHRDAVCCEGGRLHGEKHCTTSSALDRSLRTDIIHWSDEGKFRE